MNLTLLLFSIEILVVFIFSLFSLAMYRERDWLFILKYEKQKFISIIFALKPVMVDDGDVAADDDEGGYDPADDGQEPHVALVRRSLAEIVNCATNQVTLYVKNIFIILKNFQTEIHSLFILG